MTGKLVSIEGRTRPAVINREVVQTLREWLEQAEAGNLTAVALAGVMSDGCANTQVCENDDFHTLNSAIAVLQFRMMDECRQRG